MLDHKTLGKDKTLGEADVDVSSILCIVFYRVPNPIILQIWKHVQSRGDVSSADVLIELREGQGLLNLRLEFDANGLNRAGSMASLNRNPFGSPSRFSLSRRNNSDE